ncbi:hypothetical protein RJ641_018839 [Dillenia turbinata]|uniref:Uncharacterized protein n=1 Tax=Dillenia turbinata TaxID=194707 RepID=A0AAN8Z087_9MAGN
MLRFSSSPTVANSTISVAPTGTLLFISTNSLKGEMPIGERIATDLCFSLFVTLQPLSLSLSLLSSWPPLSLLSLLLSFRGRNSGLVLSLKPNSLSLNLDWFGSRGLL